MSRPRSRRVAPDGGVAVDSLYPFLGSSGRITRGLDLRCAIAAGHGLDAALRPRVWPLLLALGPWDADAPQHEGQLAEYHALLLREAAADASQARVVDVDVPRTSSSLGAEGLESLRPLLLAHLVHAPTAGYFQGMSDIAAVFPETFPQPAAAFWAFVFHPPHGAQLARRAARHLASGARGGLAGRCRGPCAVAGTHARLARGRPAASVSVPASPAPAQARDEELRGGAAHVGGVLGLGGGRLPPARAQRPVGTLYIYLSIYLSVYI